MKTAIQFLLASLLLLAASVARGVTTNAISSYPQTTTLGALDEIVLQSTNASSGGFNLKTILGKNLGAAVGPGITNAVLTSQNSSNFFASVLPEQFGAKGDGTTGDATAIQNALNAISDKGMRLLCLSPNGYLLDHPIYPPEGVTIEGPAWVGQANTTSKMPTTFKAYGVSGILITNNGVILKNLKIQGSSSLTLTPGTIGVALAGTNINGAIAYLELDHVVVCRFGGIGLWITNVDVPKINFSIIGDNWTNVVQGGYTTDLVFNHCAVSGANDEPSTQYNAVDFDLSNGNIVIQHTEFGESTNISLINRGANLTIYDCNIETHVASTPYLIDLKGGETIMSQNRLLYNSVYALTNEEPGGTLILNGQGWPTTHPIVSSQHNSGAENIKACTYIDQVTITNSFYGWTYSAAPFSEDWGTGINVPRNRGDVRMLMSQSPFEDAFQVGLWAGGTNYWNDFSEYYRTWNLDKTVSKPGTSLTLGTLTVGSGTASDSGGITLNSGLDVGNRVGADTGASTVTANHVHEFVLGFPNYAATLNLSWLDIRALSAGASYLQLGGANNSTVGVIDGYLSASPNESTASAALFHWDYANGFYPWKGGNQNLGLSGNVWSALYVTNIVGSGGLTTSSPITNTSVGGTASGLVWISTNLAAGVAPNATYPNGSILTTTNGTFFVRSNNTWVQK